MPIRPAVTADAAGIASVHVRSWQSTYKGLIPQEYLDGLDIGQRRSTWDRWLGKADWPRMGCFVAAHENDVVGFASFGPTRDEDGDPNLTGELGAIYLLPDHWGKGIGRALFQSVVGSWRMAGFREATLWVLDANARARRFYERAGWFVDGATKGDESRGFVLDEVRYRYRIEGPERESP